MTSGDIKKFLSGLGEVDFIGFGIQNPRLYVGIEWKREAKEKDPNKNVVRTFRPVLKSAHSVTDAGLRILVISDPSDSRICALGIGNKVNAIKTALVQNSATPPSVDLPMPSITASVVDGIKCSCDSCGKDNGLFLTISDENGEEGIDLWPNYKGNGVCVRNSDDDDPHMITPNDIDNIKALNPKWTYPDCLWSCMCVEDETSATVTYADGTVDDDEHSGGRFAAHLVGVKVGTLKPGTKAALKKEIQSILDAAPAATGTRKTTLLPLAGFLYHYEPPQGPMFPPLVVITPKRLWEREHHICDQSKADDAIYDDPELNALLSRALESHYEWDDRYTWDHIEKILIAKGAEEITNWDF